MSLCPAARKDARAARLKTRTRQDLRDASFPVIPANLQRLAFMHSYKRPGDTTVIGCLPSARGARAAEAIMRAQEGAIDVPTTTVTAVTCAIVTALPCLSVTAMMPRTVVVAEAVMVQDAFLQFGIAESLPGCTLLPLSAMKRKSQWRNVRHNTPKKIKRQSSTNIPALVTVTSAVKVSGEKRKKHTSQPLEEEEWLDGVCEI